MKNIKRKMLLTAAAVGALAPIALVETTEASSASLIGQNVFDAGAGHYTTPDKNQLPLVLEMLPSHPDYKYYTNKKYFPNRSGKVYLYLQQYKDSLFYYSPAIRYFDVSGKNNGKRPDGTTDEFTKEVLSRLKGTKYYPKSGNVVWEHQLRMNVPRPSEKPKANEPLGHHPSHHDTRNALGKTLNYNIKGNLNFRNRSAIPGVVWSPKNMHNTKTQGYPKKHVDTWYRHGGYNDWGEFRSLGYYSDGEDINNPYFPVDGPRQNWEKGFENYPLLKMPWAHSEFRGNSLHSGIDELTYQYAMHKGMFGLSRKNPHYNSRTDWNQAKEAYKNKKAAMTKFYDGYASVRTNLRGHGYKNRSQAIEALTVVYGSMQSPPLESGQNVAVGFARQPQWSSKQSRFIYYTYGLTLPAEPGTNSVHSAEIVKQEVIRDNKVIQTFTRDSRGKTKVTPQKAPQVEPGQKLKIRTNVILRNGFRDAFQRELEFKTNTSAVKNTTLNRKGGGNIRMKGDNIFEHTITVPDKDGTLELSTELDKKKYVPTWDMLRYSNKNTAKNVVNVVQDRGNFKAVKTELVDKKGNVVDNPIPGEQYKFRYTYKYESVNGRDARRATNVAVHFNIGREMVGDVLGKESSPTFKTKSKTIRAQHGKTYTFDTSYYLFETGQFETSATLDVGFTDYNEQSKDDTTNRRWDSAYDLEVKNVKVMPSETVNTQEQEGKALVKFDVNYHVPDHVNELGQDVSFLISVDGKTIQTTQHVRNGLNRNLSVPVDIELDGVSDKVIEATVIANHTRNVYETDILTQGNNVGSGQGQVKNPTIESFTDNNRAETWTQYVHNNRWKGLNVKYSTFTGGTRNFLRFLNKDTQSVSQRNLSERYQIDAVWFRSRLTRTEEMGPNNDGWVNLMEEEGYIRAGYGYELKIDVSYNTDAFEGDFVNQVGIDGRWTRPQLVEPLLQDNIYIEMPDGAIRSAQGDGGTEKALRLKEKDGDTSDMKWTFEIDGGESLGADTVGRFYIGENVEDGRYPLNVFTPKVRGVNGKMTSSTEILEHLLYDSAPDLGINVVGSAVDDITDHINR